MKFKVLKTFSFNDTTYEEGDIAYNLPDHVVENFCGRGYGTKDYKEEKETKSYEFLSKKDKKKKKKRDY